MGTRTRVLSNNNLTNENVMKTSKNDKAAGKNSADANGATPATDPVVYIVFASLLLDLLAFTIILPLLPSILESYRQNDDGVYVQLAAQVKYFQVLVGAPEKYSSVLFGGFLGSMFSFLQFVVSPIMGGLSDYYGRKPVLLVSLVSDFHRFLMPVTCFLIVAYLFLADWHCLFIRTVGHLHQFPIVCSCTIFWRNEQRKYFVEHGHHY